MLDRLAIVVLAQDPAAWDVDRVELLFGRLHPLLVHFPIALILAAAAAEIACAAWARERPSPFGLRCAVAGAIFAAIAAWFGWLNAAHEPSGATESQLIFVHRWLGIGAAVTALGAVPLALAAARSGGWALGAYRSAVVLAALLVAIGGHFGASLVYGPDYVTSALRGADAVAEADTVADTVANADTVADMDAARAEFARDVRPILEARCFKCHGPTRQRGLLRLDADERLFAGPAEERVVVPHDPGASILYQRITLPADHLDRMPADGDPLAAPEIAAIRKWIEAGAPKFAAPATPAPPAAAPAALGAAASDHWAFRPPVRPEPPAVRKGAWVRNEIDRFVLAQLEARGLAPAPEADRATLIRRASLDLTGLPPSPEEVDAFVADDRPGAYERLVERLLASPRFGEHMAVGWLDAARYADTHGYHYDNERTMWRWRDWVIDAFNRNLPFDEFTIEQLAGDLLPGATLDQRIATGFNRNHSISWEGGIIPEEYRLEYVADRVHTTSTVWLGLTASCARCHDHKFDPISQRDFYALAAFFDDIPEQGSDGLGGNATPFIPAPSAAQAQALAEIDAAIARAQAQYDAPSAELDEAQSAWEEEVGRAWRASWSVLVPFSFHARGRATLALQDDGSLLADGPHADRETYEIAAFTTATDIRAVRLEAMADERLPKGGPGRAEHANFVLSAFEMDVASIADPGAVQAVRFVAAHADHAQRGFSVSGAIDGDARTGWAVEGMPYGEDRVALFVPEAPLGFPGGTAIRARLRFESDYLRHAIGRVRLSITTDAVLATALAPCAYGPWHQSQPFEAETGEVAHRTPWAPETGIDLAATRDGAALWARREGVADGAVVPIGAGEHCAVYLHRVIDAPTARRVTFAFGSDDAIKAWLNGALVLESGAARSAAPDQDLVAADLAAGANELLLKVTNFAGEHAFFFAPRVDCGLEPPLDLLPAIARGAGERTDAQRRAVRDRYRLAHSPASREIVLELRRLEAERAALLAAVPTTMVMEATAEPRAMFVLTRGRYDRPEERVEPGVPAILPPLEADAPPDRLAFARWLVRPDHPLTARVAVNRLWQHLFQRGLVTTPEDFGTRGAAPSHPELLDWLATELVSRGWDVKAMLALMATSATYRQSSGVDEALLIADPENALLARAPRGRLPAEAIRDGALAASGLLVERVGGPPVKPYQPPGLWEEVGSEVAAFTANAYVQGTGDDLHRRTIYGFWKRTLPPPALQTFDAPSRDACVMRRSRTNTPLQALVLMNDTTYVEAARGLAARVMSEARGDEARAERVLRLVVGRRPRPEEVEIVADVYRRQRDEFAADPQAALALVHVGEAPLPEAADRVELAAWTIAASTVLILDEAITRP